MFLAVISINNNELTIVDCSIFFHSTSKIARILYRVIYIQIQLYVSSPINGNTFYPSRYIQLNRNTQRYIELDCLYIFCFVSPVHTTHHSQPNAVEFECAMSSISYIGTCGHRIYGANRTGELNKRRRKTNRKTIRVHFDLTAKNVDSFLIQLLQHSFRYINGFDAYISRKLYPNGVS